MCALARRGAVSDGSLAPAAGGIDVSQPETLSPELFIGVSQVVSSLGPVYGEAVDGQRGYMGGMTPQVVDAEVRGQQRTAST